jgi:hypothetical protein
MLNRHHDVRAAVEMCGDAEVRMYALLMLEIVESVISYNTLMRRKYRKQLQEHAFAPNLDDILAKIEPNEGMLEIVQFFRHHIHAFEWLGNLPSRSQDSRPFLLDWPRQPLFAICLDCRDTVNGFSAFRDAKASPPRNISDSASLDCRMDAVDVDISEENKVFQNSQVSRLLFDPGDLIPVDLMNGIDQPFFADGFDLHSGLGDVLSMIDLQLSSGRIEPVRER